MRRIFERGVVIFSWGCVLLLCCSVAYMIGFLLIKGGPALRLELVFGDAPPLDALLFKRPVFDGLLAAIAGTVVLVALSITCAIPVGIATGIYMAEYAKGYMKFFLNLIFDILACLPSIVVGLAGLSLTIFLHHQFPDGIGPCLLISSLSLSFLVLPYLIRSTQLALSSIDPTVRQTAPALGATKLQNIVYILLPYVGKDIFGGIILAIGRAAEDTAVIMLTGVVASAGLPRSLFEQFEALPFYIYYISSQYSDAHELQKGFGAAIILMVVCGLLFITAFLIQRRISYRLFAK